ncbi:MAG: hypothetical protein HKN13_00805 [Rhodothermales bacterium]|nr:hypothetical protein [Rhodothermales bacterium]
MSYPLQRRQFALLSILFISLLWVPASISQTGGEVREIDLNAEAFSSDVIDGERINRLRGGVTLKQDETRLWANEAIQYTRRDEILFSGRVMIVEAGDTLRARTVRYFRQNKTGRARGNVRLSDGDVLVTAPIAFQFIDRKYTRFESGVRLVDSLTTLESEKGEYWSDEKRALFTGGVILDEEGSTTRSDTVNFLRDESIADASGNVSVQRIEITDGDSSVVWLFGAIAHNESRNKYSTVEGDALLLQIDTDSVGADTTALMADRLTSRETDTTETMTGSGSVSIWRNQLAAVADSISFRKVQLSPDESRETVWLFGDPVLWFEDTQVRGDTIRVTMHNGELDSLFVDGNAFLAQEDTLLGRVQQVAGPTIRGSLSGSSREIRIGKGADAIYFLAEDGSGSGATKTNSNYVVMNFEGDSLRSITALENIEGTYYSEEIVPSTLQLPGFVWSPDMRPQRSLFASDPRYLAIVAESNK